ncbi:MAG: hypothetical protein IPK72_17620 [Candidatus Eisenbacteria bacterium]|nr:hypothetical protein [Candidatus Eisenbacteria bacterium]
MDPEQLIALACKRVQRPKETNGSTVRRPDCRLAGQETPSAFDASIYKPVLCLILQAGNK